MPDYSLLRAARYLGVPPWELEARPLFWRNQALFADGAERQAEAMAAAQRRRQERIAAFAAGASKGRRR